MATKNLRPPPSLSQEAIQALLAAENLPPAATIARLGTAPGYHNTYYIRLTKAIPPGGICAARTVMQNSLTLTQTVERMTLNPASSTSIQPSNNICRPSQGDSDSNDGDFFFVEREPKGSDNQSHSRDNVTKKASQQARQSSSASQPHAGWHSSLVLRVSGNHVPTIKTRNEIGAMAKVKSDELLNVPDIIAYCTHRRNPIGCEFTLLAWSPGKPLRDIWDDLCEEQKTDVLKKLMSVMVALYSCPFDAMSGLELKDGGVRPTGILDGRLWEMGEQQYWPDEKDPGDRLNLQDCYGSLARVAATQVKHYVSLVDKYQNVQLLQMLMLPRLEDFAKLLLRPQRHGCDWKLDKTRYILAHRDLHFGNILYDSETSQITAILGWEYAAVVPVQLWDPRKAFLWSGRTNDPNSSAKQRALVSLFELIILCLEPENSLAKKFLSDTMTYSSREQYAMQELVNNLRATTEVFPRREPPRKFIDFMYIVGQRLQEFGMI